MPLLQADHAADRDEKTGRSHYSQGQVHEVTAPAYEGEHGHPGHHRTGGHPG